MPKTPLRKPFLPTPGVVRPSGSSQWTWETEPDGTGLEVRWWSEEIQKEGAVSVAIAGFDLDGTLIETQSGAVFAKDEHDWRLRFLGEPIRAHLRQCIASGQRIVIFSNQGGIASGKVPVDALRRKIERVCQRLGVDAAVLLATGDAWRKPSPRMFVRLEEHLASLGLRVDRSRSSYCGDAAGRHRESRARADFSCSDRLFARNVGIAFTTPEELFAHDKPISHTLSGYNPDEFVQRMHTAPSDDELRAQLRLALRTPLAVAGEGGTKVPAAAEVLVLVGWPGSGKSTLVDFVLKPLGYVAVSQDELRTLPRCLKAAKEALQKGRPVVVDGTHAGASSRAPWIALARELNVPVRAVHLQTERALAEHLNKARYAADPVSRPRVPAVAYHVYAKRFQNPTVEEGFLEVVPLSFSPRRFQAASSTIPFQWLSYWY